MCKDLRLCAANDKIYEETDFLSLNMILWGVSVAYILLIQQIEAYTLLSCL